MKRSDALDALRGLAVLWMTAFHFAFDLNHFGFLHQNFYRDPLWTLQRTCILSLFLFCAGLSQAAAMASGQTGTQFVRRWLQIAGCALLVSAGSALVFAHSWIYFGVLHGMAVMLLIGRFTACWGRWLWPAAVLALLVGQLGAPLHTQFPQLEWLNGPAFNWLGLISRKPITEDYVPLLPWLGVLWLGLASGQWAVARGWLARARAATTPPALAPLAWLGRWSLSWYMLHQPLLMGLLTIVTAF